MAVKTLEGVQVYEPAERWTVTDASELYDVPAWGKGYFSVGENGHLWVHPNKDLQRRIDLKELVEKSTIEFPPVMLESEIDRVFHDRVGHFDKEEDFERYLAAIGRTREQVYEELKPIADLRLRRSLVLTEVSEAEKIEATDAEVDEEIERLSTAGGGQQADQLRQMFSTEGGRDTIRRNLITRKTLAKLVEVATQDGGASKAKAEGEKPKAKKTKKKAAATAEEPPAEDPADE